MIFQTRAIYVKSFDQNLFFSIKASKFQLDLIWPSFDQDAKPENVARLKKTDIYGGFQNVLSYSFRL